MKKYTRGVHFDFHTMPNIDGLLSDFNAEEFAETLKNAHTQFINFPARCNIGFSYYNTSIGFKYEGLERDILREVLDACHKRDIGVAVYINGGLNHELAYHKPEFCRQNEKGEVIINDVTDNFFRMMCWNTDYKKHFFTELEEILSYGVDGIFIDCVQAKPCYCPNCMKKMQELGVDITNEQAMTDYQQNLILELYKEIKKFVGNDIYLYINSNISIPGIHTHAEVECLPSSKLWGADYFYPASSFARPRFNKRVYMTGRFQDCWGDFGGVKTLSSLENDLYDALLSGFDFTVADHLHPKKGLFKEVSDKIKAVFEEKIKYEPYTLNAEYICDIAIIADEEDFGAPDYLKGASRMLCELKLPFDIITPNGDFKNKKLIIIPKNLSVSDTFKANLLEFYKSGGKIIFIGKGIDIAKKYDLLNGVTLIGDDEFDNSYFTFENSDIPFSSYCPAKIIKNDGGEELSKYVKGMFNFIYDGRHSYFYRPQGDITEYSTCVVKDNLAFICFDAFNAYASNFLRENKLLIKKAIDKLLPEKLIESEDLPSTAIVSLTKTDKHTVLHLKATYPSIRNGRGIIEEHNFIKRATITVKGEYKKIFSITDNKEIPATVNNGKTTFIAEDILGYNAYLLSK